MLCGAQTPLRWITVRRVRVRVPPPRVLLSHRRNRASGPPWKRTPTGVPSSRLAPPSLRCAGRRNIGGLLSVRGLPVTVPSRRRSTISRSRSFDGSVRASCQISRALSTCKLSRSAASARLRSCVRRRATRRAASGFRTLGAGGTWPTMRRGNRSVAWRPASSRRTCQPLCSSGSWIRHDAKTTPSTTTMKTYASARTACSRACLPPCPASTSGFRSRCGFRPTRLPVASLAASGAAWATWWAARPI